MRVAERRGSKTDFFLLLYRIVCTRSPLSQPAAAQSVHSQTCSSSLQAWRTAGDSSGQTLHRNRVRAGQARGSLQPLLKQPKLRNAKKTLCFKSHACSRTVPGAGKHHPWSCFPFTLPGDAVMRLEHSGPRRCSVGGSGQGKVWTLLWVPNTDVCECSGGEGAGRTHRV